MIDNTQKPTTWSDAFLAQWGGDLYNDDDDDNDDNGQDNNDDDNLNNDDNNKNNNEMISFFDTTTDLGLMYIITMIFLKQCGGQF